MELIVVLVIMAIIAALCAPNISAYVQAAKIQNYQTVANNLADELQTQLPQSRYWNWDEVQRNAYGILCSDAGRGVTLDTEKSTDNQKVYQITGASNDANAVFTVTLTYSPEDKTSQKVNVAVSCDGYAAVKSEQSCSLVLKTNYTDTSMYAQLTAPANTPPDNSGWKPMKNMAGIHEYWEIFNLANKKNDFGQVFDTNPNAFYLNLTDYPAGTCEQVMFTMQRYFVTLYRSEVGYYDDKGEWNSLNGVFHDGDEYIKEEYYNKVTGEKVSNIYNVYSEVGYIDGNSNWKNAGYGYKAGDQITAVTYYYIKDGERVEINWDYAWGNVYTDWNNGGIQYVVNKEENTYICEEKYFDRGQGNLEVEKRQNMYTCTTKYYDTYTPVYPIMQTEIAKGTGGQEQTWDLKDCSTLEIYVGTDASGNEKWVKYTDVFDMKNDHKIKNTPEAALYQTQYHDKANEGNESGASYVLDRDSGVSNVDVKYRSVLPQSTRGWLYITGQALGDSKGAKINPRLDDSLQVYINYHREDDTKQKEPVVLQTGYGINAGIEDTSDQRIWIDLTKCGYCVGNTLKITLTNVYANKLLEKFYNANGTVNNAIFDLKCTTPDGQNDGCEFNKSSTIVKTEAGETWCQNHSMNLSEYPTYDFNVYSSRFKQEDFLSLSKGADENTLIVKLKMSWNMYPYLWIFSSYCKPGFTVNSNFKMEWESGDNSEGESMTTYTPMLTINGDSTYTNITLDWTKCDYITDVSKVGIQFDKYPSGFSYDVYSKDYSLLASGQSLTKLMMGSSSKISASAAADKIIHLYCKDVSPDDISCSVIAPKAPVTTTTTTAVTSAETETETSAKTSDTAPETSASTESSTTSTTTTTTTTVTTTTTTTTAATTVTTSTTPTTASTSAASSSAAETTSATETTSASTSSTSASASSSETESTEDTTDTTASATTEASDVVTSVVTGVDNYQVLTIPNYKLLSKVEFEFTGENAPIDWECHFTDSYGWNYTFSKTFRTDDLTNNKYQIDCENVNQQGYLKVGTSTWQPKMSVKSVTFYYRNPNVTINNKLPDGYTIDKASGTALLDSSYEFTVTWNPEEYRTPTVKINGIKSKPDTIDEEKGLATYSTTISRDTEIQVNGGRKNINDNVIVKNDITLNEQNGKEVIQLDKTRELDTVTFELSNGSIEGAYSNYSIYVGNYTAGIRGWQENGKFGIDDKWNCTYEIDDTTIRFKFTGNYKEDTLVIEKYSGSFTIDTITIAYKDSIDTLMLRQASINEFIPKTINSAVLSSAQTEIETTTTVTTTTPPQTTTTTTTTQPIAASENGKNVGLDESSAAGCNITFSESLFNDSGVCYFTITPKAGYTLSDSYTVKVGTEVLSPKNNYNPKTNQWFFWSNKSMTDYTIHVEGISPAA